MDTPTPNKGSEEPLVWITERSYADIKYGKESLVWAYREKPDTPNPVPAYQSDDTEMYCRLLSEANAVIDSLKQLLTQDMAVLRFTRRGGGPMLAAKRLAEAEEWIRRYRLRFPTRSSLGDRPGEDYLTSEQATALSELMVVYPDGTRGMLMFHWVPADADMSEVAQEGGYEIKGTGLFDDPTKTELQQLYEKGEDLKSLMLWEPKVPEGWKLGATFDGEEGPGVLFVKKA